MNKLLLMTTIFFVSTYAIAGNLVSISISNEKKEIKLNQEQMSHIYGKAISHLETCSIGNYRDLLNDDNISIIENTDHIKITFKENNVSLPVGTEIKNLNVIYILFHKGRNSIAQIATIEGNNIQHYSKCSGLSALYNLTCDRVISGMMEIPSHPSCEAVIYEYEKRL